jgi:hypothetical protein
MNFRLFSDCSFRLISNVQQNLSIQCWTRPSGITLQTCLNAPALCPGLARSSDWLTGGELGPEASLLVFPVIAMMFVAFHRLYPAAIKTGPATAKI